MGCECDSGYEGSHCQFVAGTKPKNWPTKAAGLSSPSTKSPKQFKGAAIFIIVLISIVLVLGVLFVVRRESKKRKREEIEVASKDKSDSVINGNGVGDLTLEVDGSSMKDQMATGSTLPATKGKFPEVETIMDEEAEII